MRKLSKVPLLGLASLAIASQAHADVAFHGYGQIVAGTVFSNNRTFPAESQGYSYHADPTFTPNSNFALQATAPLDSSISATAQILARGDDDFQPKFQWAYLKYQLNDTYALKAGRLQLPFYQYSDYQFVGEAYPWVLPPEAVYFAQESQYDGLDLSAEKSWGNWYFYMQAMYGSFDNTALNPVATPNGTVTTSVTVHDHNITGLTLDSSYNDWLTLRAAAFVEKLSLVGDGNKYNPLTTLDSVVSSLISQNQPDAAKAISTSDDPYMYVVASAQIARNNFLFLAEFQGLQPIAGASGFGPSIASEYVSLGYHFGKLLPLATLGHRNQYIRANKIKSAINGNPNVTIPFVLPNGNVLNVPAPADSVVDGLAENPGVRLKDYFYEFGLRYDLTPTVALKLDYTFYESHWKTTDYPTAAAGGAVNPPNASRLLGAVTFSF